MHARLLTIEQPTLLETFYVNGTMAVCDPAYDRDDRYFHRLGGILQVKPGRWGLFTRSMGSDFVYEGRRIVDRRNMLAIVVHHDLFRFFTSNARFHWNYSGFSACVDSGRVGFHNFDEYPSESHEPERYDQYYRETCDIGEGVLHDYNSAMAYSGFGDGQYNVYVARASTGAIVAVKAEFMEDFVGYIKTEAIKNNEQLIVRRPTDVAPPVRSSLLGTV